ncbi:DNA cytosine methyltransferase [Streptomyces sp. NPDC091259]|uniref:DNA cytosine methyltransferase n=1 Tax=Streptomyces sp. NPDC091259 TaxID=3365976 RepID=UPI00382C021C
MPILELCAGYGGLGMAVEALTGDRVAYVAEVDEAACKVLALRYPDAPNIGDITAYDWTKLRGDVDVVTAGWPCTDISNAGPKLGLDGERSGIWRNVADAVRVLRPRLVFLENVRAILRRGLPTVLGDLAGVGYDVRWMCLPQSAVRGPSERYRWFALASPADGDGVGWAGRSGDVGQAQGRDESPDGYSPAVWWGEYAAAVRRWEDELGRPAPFPGRRGPRGGWRPSPYVTEWQQGLPAGWITDVPGITPDEMVTLAGNGVCPQQAATAYELLHQHEAHTEENAHE